MPPHWASPKLNYIVAEEPDGGCLVGQHAAHDRVLFNALRRSAADQAPQSQPLLKPATVELTTGQVDVLDANTAYLKGYWFQVESLFEPEMRAPLEQADNAHTYPHGCPTMIHTISYHMNREF